MIATNGILIPHQICDCLWKYWEILAISKFVPYKILKLIMSSVSDIFLYECKDIYLFNSVKVLNQNPLLNSSAMEASMSFGRTSSLETAVIFFFFFTDPIQHGHQLHIFSHNTLLMCLNPSVKGAIIVKKEMFACHIIKSFFSVC